jgi:alpha-N-arabinofuranosidase
MKIACGASGNDYAWTETLMRIAGDQMDGLSLHAIQWEKGFEGKVWIA